MINARLVQKLFRLPAELADRLEDEAARTKRPQVRIVERALNQFFTLTPEERERFGTPQTASAPAPNPIPRAPPQGAPASHVPHRSSHRRRTNDPWASL
jgi:predicted DNA-binding protein